ncbi:MULTISPECIES: DUF928 domain-containing protein [unclassified Coleofasciculus]|uniref:DUF928 domain-containing protein n=1 Tax=unclassified Coleofasciculus TaxID=2692782 RepID=UPI001882088F|nr:MULTISPECIES: DUF928 domain-containing protein [unclassified Coleofasciculus]MBE9128189.1 DUF928 domain-containing protein [Coleofasciculus sp. LEGE 07081]MBE9151259.1 DUF928 domain-containing protein [Coleofasciculus sp. LEGE 07092]
MTNKIRLFFQTILGRLTAILLLSHLVFYSIPVNAQNTTEVLNLGKVSNNLFLQQIQVSSKFLETPASQQKWFRWLRGGRKEKQLGESSRRGDAGRRGQCSLLNPPLFALVPEEPFDKTLGNVLPEGLVSSISLTVSEYPIFWFYIPNLPPNLDYSKLEFMLQDNKNNDIFDEPFRLDLDGISGIVGLRIPSTHGLKIEKLYHWYLSIICDPRRPSRNPNVDGWVQRVALTDERERQLQVAKPRKRVEIYAKESIWHETLTLLATSRCFDLKESEFAANWNQLWQNPELAADWNDLLEAVGLSEIAQEPSCSILNLKQ